MLYWTLLIPIFTKIRLHFATFLYEWSFLYSLHEIEQVLMYEFSLVTGKLNAWQTFKSPTFFVTKQQRKFQTWENLLITIINLPEKGIAIEWPVHQSALKEMFRKILHLPLNSEVQGTCQNNKWLIQLPDPKASFSLPSLTGQNWN